MDWAVRLTTVRVVFTRIPCEREVRTDAIQTSCLGMVDMETYDLVEIFKPESSLVSEHYPVGGVQTHRCSECAFPS